MLVCIFGGLLLLCSLCMEQHAPSLQQASLWHVTRSWCCCYFWCQTLSNNILQQPDSAHMLAFLQIKLCWPASWFVTAVTSEPTLNNRRLGDCGWQILIKSINEFIIHLLAAGSLLKTGKRFSVFDKRAPNQLLKYWIRGLVCNVWPWFHATSQLPNINNAVINATKPVSVLFSYAKFRAVKCLRSKVRKGWDQTSALVGLFQQSWPRANSLFDPNE